MRPSKKMHGRRTPWGFSQCKDIGPKWAHDWTIIVLYPPYTNASFRKCKSWQHIQNYFGVMSNLFSKHANSVRGCTCATEQTWEPWRTQIKKWHKCIQLDKDYLCSSPVTTTGIERCCWVSNKIQHAGYSVDETGLDSYLSHHEYIDPLLDYLRVWKIPQFCGENLWNNKKKMDFPRIYHPTTWYGACSCCKIASNFWRAQFCWQGLLEIHRNRGNTFARTALLHKCIPTITSTTAVWDRVMNHCSVYEVVVRGE